MQSLFFVHADPGAPVPPVMHSPMRVSQFTWQVLPPPHWGVTGSQPGKRASPKGDVPPSAGLQFWLGLISTDAVATLPILMTAVVEPVPNVQPALRTVKSSVTVPERPPEKFTDRSFVLT